MAADEQLERRLGALERQAVGLELLDEPRQLARVDALELVPQLARPDGRVRPAAELGDDEPAGVPDGARLDVLVRPLDLGDGRPVDAALVGERRPADVRLVVVGREVGDLGDAARQLGQALEAAATGAAPARAGVLSARFARIDTMLALPARSP